MSNSNDNRLCLFRHFVAEEAFEVSVYPVRLDTYGTVPHRGPGSFRHEQHLVSLFVIVIVRR